MKPDTEVRVPLKEDSDPSAPTSAESAAEAPQLPALPAPPKKDSVTYGSTSIVDIPKKVSLPPPEKPVLTAVDEELQVSWTITSFDPPVAFTSVAIRVVGEEAYRLLDVREGKTLLVPKGGKAIEAPICMVVVALQHGVSYQAMVAMRNSAGPGPWSPPSDALLLEASSSRSVADTAGSPLRSLAASNDMLNARSSVTARATARALAASVNRGDDNPKEAWSKITTDNDGTTGDVDLKAQVPKPTLTAVPESERIPLSRKIIFSAPTVATLPFVAMWGMHGNKNYQAFGANLAMIALFTALARSLDVVSDPLMSYVTDSASCDKLPAWLRGRRKPFMFFGCFIYSALLWMLLNPPYAGTMQLSLWFGCCYTLYFLSNTITTIPYDALAPELSNDSKERTGLFFVANLFDGIGTLIALGLPILMTLLSDQTPRNEDICLSDLEKARMCLAGRSCGNFMTQGFDAAYSVNTSLSSTLQNLTADMYTPFHLTTAGRQCIQWLRTRSPDDMLLHVSLSNTMQNDNFCECVGTCGDACDVANKRTGFMFVGSIFAIWFVFTMVAAVIFVPERQPERARPKAPPIVPSMKSALSNRLFRILLPAWLCDAFVTAITQSLVPYFVEAVVAPAYQTMEKNGRDCFQSSTGYDGDKWLGHASLSDHWSYDPLCSTDNVIAICGLLALVTAILVLPVWNLLVSRIGKVRTWFLWSLTMAASNVLFLFIWKGGIWLLFVVCAINGLPLGAKFLADAILADIIDYDEFLTGMRSEATYFMFKSFLPKIVQIPATAIPIALLGAFSYKPPIGGKVQDQPESVSNYIRCVVGLGFLCSLCAYFLKIKYPLHEDGVARLAKALKDHKEGKWARDPVSRRPYKPLTVSCEDEQEVFWLFNHFNMANLEYAFTQLPCERQVPEESLHERFAMGSDHMVRSTRKQLVVTSCFLIGAMIGSGSTMVLLDDEKWQFVPTLFVVCIGLGISSTAFTALRHKAAIQLKRMSAGGEASQANLVRKVERLLHHQAEITLLGCQARDAQLEIEKLGDAEVDRMCLKSVNAGDATLAPASAPVANLSSKEQSPLRQTPEKSWPAEKKGAASPGQAELPGTFPIETLVQPVPVPPQPHLNPHEEAEFSEEESI